MKGQGRKMQDGENLLEAVFAVIGTLDNCQCSHPDKLRALRVASEIYSAAPRKWSPDIKRFLEREAGSRAIPVRP